MECDYTFKEEDIAGLAEALAEIVYKWEEIAVALRLSEAVRAECREGSSLAMKLYRVLYQWVVGQHSNAAQATRENLKTALTSPLVQHPQLACELEDKLKTSMNLHTLTASRKKSIYKSGVREMSVQRYSQCQEVPHNFWPPVVSKSFINLALIETIGKPLKSDYSIGGDADDVLAKKTLVKYEDVFEVYKRKKKILILGRPGSGKTTLVHKLVRDWSAGKALQGAELVFLVSLRMLNTKKYDLPQLLSRFFLSKDLIKQIVDAMDQTQGERVCFIFDGFDEYCPPEKEESVVFSLLNKSYLVDAMIIVTSRPAAASGAAQIFDRSYKKIEVFGFCKSQIMEYITYFPFSSSSINESQKLHSYLSSHPGVLDLCYLPVNCAIICFVYDTEQDHLPDTQTQIYALFTRLIIMRQLTSRDISRQLDSLEDLEGQEAEDFKKLCSLAFDMTTQSQQVITRGPASSDEAHSLGLVTTDITAGLSGYKNSYSFLHLTLQEFLAAYHLSKLNQEKQMSLIEKYGEAVHMLTVWKYYFGLVNFETGLDRAEKLFANVSKSYGHELYQIQCSYEAQQACISELVSSSDFSFSKTLSNYDLSALAYTISITATAGGQVIPTECLSFSSLGPESGKFGLFINQLSDRALEFIVNLGLRLCPHFSFTDMELLARVLKVNRIVQTEARGLKCLKHLNLCYNCIRDEGVAVLATGLDGNHVLESLNLSGNLISASGVSELMKADCHLKDLNLSHNNICDEGAIAVAIGLRHNRSLKSINLLRNKIGAAGVGALALVLQGCIHLDLAHNKFTFDSALPDTVISHDTVTSDCCYNFPITTDSTTEDLKGEGMPHNCTLEKLNLSCNICDGDPVTTISKFKSLSDLNLSCNKLSLPGAMAVVDYVANSDNCQQLKCLNLYSIVCRDFIVAGISPSMIMDYDLQQKLPLSSGFFIDLSRNDINMTKAHSILKMLNRYDRVGGIYLESNSISIDKKNIDDLTEAFRHDHMDRLLAISDYNHYLSITVSARSSCASEDQNVLYFKEEGAKRNRIK